MAHTYWRLYFPNSPAGGPGVGLTRGVCCVGVEMRESIAGPNVVSGGTASASSTASDTSAANGFVAYSGTTRWETDNFSSSSVNSYPAWLSYQFAAPVEIEEITMTGVATTHGTGATTPPRIVLQYSDDGIAWTSKYFWQTTYPWVTNGTDNRTFNTANAVDYTFVSEARALSIINYPAEEVRATQLTLTTAFRQMAEVQATQIRVLSLVRGRVDSPKIRAWWFPLDEHRMYVLRLGSEETLIYDVHSQQWYVWGSGVSPLWRAYQGISWQSGRGLVPDYSGIVVGDDGNGSIYFLSPDDDTDDDAIEGSDLSRPFTRQIIGQISAKSGYNRIPCFGVQLMGSTGEGDDDLTVKLEVSDDRGHTYSDMGDIALNNSEYDQRVNWLSLGSFTAPGRLFRITDTGALKRIDTLEMKDPE